MNPIRPFLMLTLALGLVASGLALAQAGTGNLYRVTTKVEMQGMPFAMPATSVEVCGPKEQASEKMVPHDKNCKVTDFRIVGNKSTYRMACTGENPMTGTGEFERLSADAYRGRMKMDMRMDGQPMQMTMNFDGKKIRDCNYATESPQAQGAAMMGKACADMLRQPSHMVYESFTAPGAMCAKDKARYCSAMTAQNIKPDMIRTGTQLPHFWEALAACGSPRPVAIAKACTMAEAARDFGFLTDYCPSLVAKACTAASPQKDYEFVVASCPAQAQAAAAQHCAGRDFTAMRASPFGNFCSRYAAGSLQQRNSGAAGRPATDRPATGEATEEAPKKPTWRERLKAAQEAVTGG